MTRVDCSCWLVGGLVLALGMAGTARGVEVLEDTIQPLPVSNGGFDLDLSSWTPWIDTLPSPDAFSVWSPLDFTGAVDVGSGSAQFVNLVASAGGTYIAGADCFHLESIDQALRVRLRYRVASGSGRLWVQLWNGFHGDTPEFDPPCTGPAVSHALGGPVTATDGFVEFDSGWVPATAGPIASLDLGFAPFVPLSPYVAYIDDVRVDVARMSTVFEDGLETE